MNTDFNFFDYDSFVKKSSVEYITNNLSNKTMDTFLKNMILLIFYVLTIFYFYLIEKQLKNVLFKLLINILEIINK